MGRHDAQLDAIRQSAADLIERGPAGHEGLAEIPAQKVGHVVEVLHRNRPIDAEFGTRFRESLLGRTTFPDTRKEAQGYLLCSVIPWENTQRQEHERRDDPDHDQVQEQAADDVPLHPA